MSEKRVSHIRTKFLIAAALFAALTAIGAQIRVPLPFGVPITMQTFFVLLSGFLLGSTYGPLSQVFYVCAGLIGFPVFVEGGGLSYILKPTFGYLLGYPLASYTVAALVYRRAEWVDLFSSRHYLGTLSNYRLAFAGIGGYLAIFLPGITYLYLATNYILGVPTALRVVLTGGFLVFIPGDIIKLSAIVLFLSFWAIQEN